ncbi:hypothetical protein ACJRO7_022036 [Eucalyptus globulus]|uniref:Methyltransferase n=1 Tax=Eucalyptus globulus TaxID=34317 RepID=A0ABD3KNC8_EUCGL
MHLKGCFGKLLLMKFVSFPKCSLDYQDYTPCTDPKRWRKYGMHRLTFMEHHCPAVFERKECLVPPREGYEPPIRWPKSRDECWYRSKEISNQNWLRKQGEKFPFPGGGTMFHKGVSAYVDLMQDLIPGMKDGTVRTPIDTGCGGIASWGGTLLDHGILTISLAPRDNHEAQVQFALERGIPAILGIISTQWLPFLSNSFDMAHYSRCLIPWTEFEINRILQPGGFWVLSGPPVNYQNRWRGWNTTVQEQKSDYDRLQKLLTSMCFKLYNKKDDIAMWQKTSNSKMFCQLQNLLERFLQHNRLAKPDAYPPKCDDSLELDSAWYTPLHPCVVVPDPKLKNISLKSIPHVAPERMSKIQGGSASAFKHDDSKWKVRAKHYKKVLPALGTDKIRNVMDMNTVYGGIAATLIDDPLWVMNVVLSYSANTLAINVRQSLNSKPNYDSMRHLSIIMTSYYQNIYTVESRQSCAVTPLLIIVKSSPWAVSAEEWT